MRNILNFFHNKYYYLFFFTIKFFFGFFLITNSIIYLLSYEGDFKSQKVTKLKSIINIHLDFPNISILDNNKKNSQSIAKSTVIQKLSDEFYLPKDKKTKKEDFILSILPHVIQKNENILNNRKRLLNIRTFLITYKTLEKIDQIFLEKIASEYKIDTHNKHKIDVVEVLLESVDVIPNSIVLAQAANESGWGTSRFAKDYNAIFGEYTFDIKNGVVPIYRDKEDKHLIKFFSTINDSVGSYFKNLNTHSAYKKFRETRKNLRSNKLKLDPIVLIEHLKPYAKDENYVKNIRSIIRTNQLIQFDRVKTIITKS